MGLHGRCGKIMSIKTNAQLHEEITEEFDRFKRYTTSRQHRIEFANTFVENYFLEHQERPNSGLLQRLATLILQDEMSVRSPHKMSTSEYPILTASQERKRKGKGARKNSLMGEISQAIFKEVSVDGQLHRKRTRDDNRRLREIYGI